jgi:hypothetical protein
MIDGVFDGFLHPAMIQFITGILISQYHIGNIIKMHQDRRRRFDRLDRFDIPDKSPLISFRWMMWDTKDTASIKKIKTESILLGKRRLNSRFLSLDFPRSGNRRQEISKAKCPIPGTYAGVRLDVRYRTTYGRHTLGFGVASLTAASCC